MRDRRIIALAMLAALAAGCTSGSTVAPEDPPSEIGDVVDLGDVRTQPLHVNLIELIEIDRLEVSAQRPCGERRVQVEETITEVDISIHDVVPTDVDCGGEEAYEWIVVDLDSPFGDRELVIEVSAQVFERPDEARHPCFRATDRPWCEQLTIRHNSERRTSGLPRDFGVTPSATIAVDGDTAEIVMSTGRTVSVTWSDAPSELFVVEHRSMWNHGADPWGSVIIHNVDRMLSADDVLRQVDGFPAIAVSLPDEPGGPEVAMTIDVEGWFVDVVLFTRSPADRPAAMTALLDVLQITPRPGQPPLVVDPSDTVGPPLELMVVDGDGRGATISFSRFCTEIEIGCRPGLGYISEGALAFARVAGAPPFGDATEWSPGRSLPVPDGLDVVVVDEGTAYDLVECSGIPWYDPALLPTGMTLEDAMHENWQRSGIRDWTWRDRPGAVSGHTGPASNPDAVARFEQREDEMWDVISVTQCL